MVVRQRIYLLGMFFWAGMALAPMAAEAHGINGHIHVTAWSMAELQNESLLALLDNTEVVDAMLFGAAFPDTGYASDAAYGEPAHWEPFVERLVAYVRQEYPPPYEDLEAKKRVAFIMGMAAHGLQDEIFDTLFLVQVDIHDGATQDDVDPATDAFLEVDGHLEFKPAMYAPVSDLIEVFRQSGVQVSARDMETGMNRVKTLVIDFFSGLAQNIDAELRPRLSWTLAHYLDETVPGSLRSEVPATAAYMEAVWARLHDQPPVAARVAYGFPESPRRIRTVGPGVDAWVTLVFGRGVRVGSISHETVHLLDENGQRVDIDVAASRWATDPDAVSRLLVVKPVGALRHDHHYGVRLNSGLQYVDGSRLDEPWTFRFQTPCAPDMEVDCPVEEEPRVDAGPIGLSADATRTEPSEVGMRINPEMGVPVASGTQGGSQGCASVPGVYRPDLWVLGLCCFVFGTARRRWPSS